uniref:Uncharacterized protein n=1 Tax=Parastrongyloides trichosuri TaxID=131310 RepID=A0A0N4ZS74_PARTI
MAEKKQDNEFAVSLVSFQCPNNLERKVDSNNENMEVEKRSRSRQQTQKYVSSNNLNTINFSKTTPRERSSSAKRNQKRTTVAFGLTTNYDETVLAKLEDKCGEQLNKNKNISSSLYSNRTPTGTTNSSTRLCLTERQEDTGIVNEVKRNSYRINRIEGHLSSIEKKCIGKMDGIESKLDTLLNKLTLQNDHNSEEKEYEIPEDKLKDIIVKKMENDIEFKRWMKKEFIKSDRSDYKESKIENNDIVKSSKVKTIDENVTSSPYRNVPLSINSKNYLTRQFGKENQASTAPQSFVQSLISMDLKEPGSPIVFESNVNKKSNQTPKSRFMSEDLLNSPIDQDIVFEETFNRQRNKK